MSNYSLRCFLLTYALLRTVSEIDPAGERLFLKYGSNIRRIMDILKRPEEEAAYIQDDERGRRNRPGILDNISGPRKFGF